jgi:hypothetical protein
MIPDGRAGETPTLVGVEILVLASSQIARVSISETDG